MSTKLEPTTDKRSAIHRDFLKRLGILAVLMLAFAALAQTLSSGSGDDDDASEVVQSTTSSPDTSAAEDELLAEGDDELEVLEDDDPATDLLGDAEGSLPPETDDEADADALLAEGELAEGELAEGEPNPDLKMDASMKKFVPTEKISEDRSVAFPNDI